MNKEQASKISILVVVIFITGFADLTLEDAYDKGACAVMSKPFDRKALMETVERAVQGYTEKFDRPVDVQDGNLKVDLQFQDGSQAIQAKILKIGQGGMFLGVQEQQVMPDQIIHFKIERPAANLPLLYGQGVIRWVKVNPSDGAASGFGVEFIYLNENCRRDVIEFLKNLKVKAYIPKAA